MRFLILLVVIYVSFFVPAAYAEDSIDIPTRSGVTMEILYQRAKDPPAHLILFEGGPGVFKDLEFPGFLFGTRNDFRDKGFSVAAVNPPSDTNEDMRRGFRSSAEHVQDIEILIQWLKKQKDVPVWLLGVSLGTQSVAWLGSTVKEKLGGLILISSKTRGKGISILDMDLYNIKVPVLIVHHKDDNCPGTPLSATNSILAKLENSPNAKMKLFDGGQIDGDAPCFTGTPHTFHGIQNKVADAISEFIKANIK